MRSDPGMRSRQLGRAGGKQKQNNIIKYGCLPKTPRLTE